MLRTEKFDVVHVHSPHLGLLFTLVAMFSRPSVLRRSVLHVHSNYHVYRPRNRWMLLPAFLAFGRIVCCSRSSRASFPWPYRLAAGRRLVTICNGVDLRRVDAAWQPMGMRTHKRDRPLQLITVGHLRTLKNQATVIRALAQARSEDVCLKIVGDGPDRGALEELAESLGLASRVTFTGRLGRDEVFQQLWRADAFIAMSRGEGLPIAVLEAMSCHCPVVLSDIPGHREVSEGRTDLVPFVKPDDCASLAACHRRVGRHAVGCAPRVGSGLPVTRRAAIHDGQYAGPVGRRVRSNPSKVLSRVGDVLPLHALQTPPAQGRVARRVIRAGEGGIRVVYAVSTTGIWPSKSGLWDLTPLACPTVGIRYSDAREAATIDITTARRRHLHRWHPAQRGRASPAAKNGKDCNGIFVCSNSGPLSPNCSRQELSISANRTANNLGERDGVRGPTSREMFAPKWELQPHVLLLSGACADHERGRLFPGSGSVS